MRFISKDNISEEVKYDLNKFEHKICDLEYIIKPIYENNKWDYNVMDFLVKLIKDPVLLDRHFQINMPLYFVKTPTNYSSQILDFLIIKSISELNELRNIEFFTSPSYGNDESFFKKTLDNGFIKLNEFELELYFNC